MDERATGIILRVRPLTETSLIVHWLTPDLGRIATVAKGARRTKSPYIGKLDLFFELDFSFARSRRSALHTLREVVLRETRPGIRRSIESVAIASYFAVLIEKTTETETPLPEIFVLLKEALGGLESCPNLASLFLAFELQLLTELGVLPALNASNLGESARRVGEQMLQFPLNEAGKIDAGRTELNQLNTFILLALRRIVDRVPEQRSRAINLIRPARQEKGIR